MNAIMHRCILKFFSAKRSAKHWVLKVRRSSGSMLVSILVITGLFVSLGMLALQFIITQNNAANFRVNRERALQIAEAGAEYYRWHLAHVPEDFKDGTGNPGPYVHTYYDATNNPIGTFTLEITPPPSGSTVVTVKSAGQLTNKPTSKRTITMKMGIPSFTQWAVVANADMRFGEGTEVFGPIHSNGGIRFDGVAHNLVTSLQYSYDDADHTGNQEFGVHTHVNAPPATGVDNTFRPLEAPTVTPPPYQTPPTRSDVFQVGRQFPVPQVDFDSMTSDLSTLKTKADANGIHLLPSGGQGYHITLRADGKVDMRIVNTQLRCQYNSSGTWRDYGYCSNNFNAICTQNSNCSGGAICIQSSASIGSRSADQASFTYQSASSLGVDFPTNGIIFVEDDAWVDGTIDDARVSIIAAREPMASGSANIYINKDLKYTHYDGTDAIGLIAQTNILVGFFSENDLRVDAALIAQNGRIGRAYYGASFTTSTNNANFQLYPTGGVCSDTPSRTCTVNGDCTDFCQNNPSRACTTNPQCNNYCQNYTGRACTTNANCNNYCQTDTSKTCNVTNDCRYYCQGDRTRSCTSNNKCNGWCTGNHNKGCSNNGDCTGFGTCDSGAPDVGPCQTTSTGPCITGDTCVTGDSCVVTGDTCSLSQNPDGGTTCQEYRKRTLITTYGSLATNQRYGFAWTGYNLFNCGSDYNNSGYCDRNLIFDSYLAFAPPPSFPTTGEYKIISWEEN